MILGRFPLPSRDSPSRPGAKLIQVRVRTGCWQGDIPWGLDHILPANSLARFNFVHFPQIPFLDQSAIQLDR